MQERLKGASRKAKPVSMGEPVVTISQHQVILGIDPSLRGTGYGVIRLAKPFPIVIAQGVVASKPSWPRSRCLLNIAQTLRDLLKKTQPTVCAIEGLFFAQNLQTALIMGEARGVCLVAAAEAGLDIYEIAARKVKQALVGYGAAQKLAVAKMVQRLLNLPEAPQADAADALALAIAFTQESRTCNLTPLKAI